MRQSFRLTITKINSWFLSPTSMFGMAQARIIIGLLLFAFYSYRLPHSEFIFGPDGLGGRHFFNDFPDAIFGIGLNKNTTPDQSLFFIDLHDSVLLSTNTLFHFFYFLTILSALLFTFGLYTRLSGFTLLFCHSLFLARNPYAYSQWASVLKAFIFYISISDSAKCLSLDRWIWKFKTLSKKEELSNLGPAWPLRLLQIHVCLIYILAAWTRWPQFGWLHGEMLNVALVNQQFSRFNTDYRPYVTALKSGTYLGWGLEMIAPLALWIPSCHNLIIFALVMLHLALEALGHFGGWSFMMIAGVLTFQQRPFLKSLIKRFINSRHHYQIS